MFLGVISISHATSLDFLVGIFMKSLIGVCYDLLGSKFDMGHRSIDSMSGRPFDA